MQHSRREFLKTSCTACLGALVLGFTLESCKSNALYKTTALDKKIKVPTSLFTAEQTNVIVRVPELEYDVLVQKKGETYKALYLKCTHRDNPVYLAQGQLTCNLHGSTFDLEGQVTNGPAEDALKKFNILLEEEHLIILI